MKYQIRFLAMLFPCLCAVAGETAFTGKDVVLRETLTNQTEFTVSAKSEYVFSSDFDDDGQGDQDAANSEIRLGVAVPISGNIYVTGTGFYKRFDFGTSNAPVPTTLQSVGADLSVEYRYKGEPALGIQISPGFYGSELDSDGFNVPVLVAGSYYLTPKFILGLGVSYDSFREYEFLPLVGFRLLVSDTVRVNALFPELNVTYACGDNVIYDVGAKFAGGSFKTSDNEQNYGGTEIDYTDIRVGSGIRYNGWKPFEVYVNAGWSFQRKFRYDEYDQEFETKGAPYAGVQLSAKF